MFLGVPDGNDTTRDSRPCYASRPANVIAAFNEEKLAPMRHMAQLDGVRALAVMIVVVSHAGLGALVPGGFGVTMFFFLSGFLITSLMRSEAVMSGRIDLRAFYIRRTLRIMPPLYITLALMTVVNSFGWFGTRVSEKAIIWDYLFLTNYSHFWNQEGGLPIPLWSLAVEEHFYIFFPIVFVLLLMKVSNTRAAQICLLICGIILALRVLTLFLEPSFLYRNYYWSHTRIDSIIFGCCLALWQNPIMESNAWKPKHWHAAVAVGIILLTFLIPGEEFRQTVRYTIQGIGLFILFSYLLSDRAPLLISILKWKPISWIGLVSYTLYLIHFPIFVVLERLFGPNLFIIGVGGTVLAIGYSWVMRVLVEKPIMRWRHRSPLPEKLAQTSSAIAASKREKECTACDAPAG